MDKDTLMLDIDSINFVAYLTVKDDRLKSERTLDYIKRNIQDLELIEKLAPRGWTLDYRRDSNKAVIAKVKANEITYTLDLLPADQFEREAALRAANDKREALEEGIRHLEEALKAKVSKDAIKDKQRKNFFKKSVPYLIGAAAAALVAGAVYVLSDGE